MSSKEASPSPPAAGGRATKTTSSTTGAGDNDDGAASFSNEQIKLQLIEENGWDQGLILFGFLGSETTVKVNMAIRLAIALRSEEIGFTLDDIVHVDMSFDDKPLKTDPKTGKQSVGVRSEEWLILSNDKGYMPALLMDGKMYQESDDIVKMLATKYPDPTLKEEQQLEVMRWVNFNCKYQSRLLDIEKHFGTAALSPKEKNYIEFGPGKKDKEWEIAAVADVNKFMKTLDDYFQSKPDYDRKYFIANKLTYADIALINWPYTLFHLTGLKVSTRYPNLWCHHLDLKSVPLPPGSEEHYKVIPMLGMVVGSLTLWDRGILNYGHHIENPIYWDNSESAVVVEKKEEATDAEEEEEDDDDDKGTKAEF